VAGLVTSFGSGAMTNSIEELRHAGCIFAIGTNTTSAHPVLALNIKEAVRNGATLIVANPKEIDLAEQASIVLRHRPGTDTALLMGMMRVIVDEGLQDEQFIAERCENFAEFRESLNKFDPDFVEQTTGVPWGQLAEAARAYATKKPSSICYAMGITQHTHGTDNVMATANLAMLTGNIGKPSTGVNPLRGQNNVQGACDMGALPNNYPGYQKVFDPEVKQKFETAWGCELNGSVGLTLTEVFHAISDGQVKAFYMVGENPVLADADANHVEEALRDIEFLVCQDIFMTETAKYAHVVLPAASFAEKDGTNTNTERRVQRVRPVIEPVGDSKPDWWIVCEIAKRMAARGFDFTRPEEIMAEIAAVTPSYGGMSYDRLENGGLQWPCPNAEHPGTPFLHAGKFARGKGRFVPLEYKQPAELPDEKYPLTLTTDRSLYHFHTSTMSRRVEGLDALDGQELLRIHPEDAARFEVADGDLLQVASRRGKITVRANVTEVCPPGVVSLTFHFAEAPTNVLTHAALDPVAKIPETKVCAVRVEKVEENV
jgi:formate dehydrogenase alpha subunit